MPIYSELAALLDDVAGRVDRWTRQEAWEPEPGSRGAAELANTEVRADGSPWGERPTRTVFQLGQMQMKMVVEYARSTALLVAVPLEYSISSLTCAFASRLDVVMVSLPGAAQERLRAYVPGAQPGCPGVPR